MPPSTFDVNWLQIIPIIDLIPTGLHSWILRPSFDMSHSQNYYAFGPFYVFPMVAATFVFATRCYASAACAVMQCPSVRLFVCLSRSWILAKRINISSKIFHQPHHSSFSVLNVMQYSDVNPSNGGVKCRPGLAERFWRRIAGYGWMTASVNSNCDVHRALCRRDGDEFVYYSLQHGRPLQREENRAEFNCTQQ